MATIPVNTSDASYGVMIRPGLIANAGPIVAELAEAERVFVVTDTNVAELHLEKFADSLQQAGVTVETAIIPAGEPIKTLATVAQLYDVFLDQGIERGQPVVALGGGVVGDLAGFVAATTLRGVPFINAPTSLLAMVDASVGGKTAVNHPKGKNLVGAFWPPLGVLIDPTLLKTLPIEHIREGLAECIKHDVLRDAAGFARLEANIHRALELDVDYLIQLITHNVSIKADVVQEDPYEHGVRKHLNFGHTFAHALESASDHRISHGKAVAMGMVAACEMAHRRHMFSHDSVQRVKAVIEKAGLPTRGHGLPADTVLSAMSSDKKRSSGKLNFVLPQRIGSVVVQDDLTNADVLAAIEIIQ